MEQGGLPIEIVVVPGKEAPNTSTPVVSPQKQPVKQVHFASPICSIQVINPLPNRFTRQGTKQFFTDEN